MAKAIAAVQVDLISDTVVKFDYGSMTSLLDFDIVIFRPRMSYHFSLYPTDRNYYQGLKCLDDTASFELKKHTSHWNREILEAVRGGKTVIVLMSEYEEVFVATGDVSHSGTGRSRVTTRHVTNHNNYMAIPIQLSAVVANGNSMRLATRGAEWLSGYWKEFEAASSYHATLEGTSARPTVLTKSGNKTVGLLFKPADGNGHLVLLPDIETPRTFSLENSKAVVKAAEQFGHRFIEALLRVDESLRSTDTTTPAPEWVSDEAFSLIAEAGLRARILDTEREISLLSTCRSKFETELAEVSVLKGLLYETGKPLEQAILKALTLLGFKAEPFNDASSEFDAVFESAEGRFIGEAEGKDSKPISVEKLRQLAMNIQEDLRREEVMKPAKPVLFGNGDRLAALENRGEPFTLKCRTAAEASNTVLVPTPELFKVARQQANYPDEAFARSCRIAMLEGQGLVKFPQVRERRAEATLVDGDGGPTSHSSV